MEVVRLSEPGEVAGLVCEFLEVVIHQLLCIRELYPPETFERRRHFNVPVQWARHPDLREYIHSAVTNLHSHIQQGVVEKVALLVTDSNHIPVEKFVFKVSLKQLSKAGVPAQHLEFALRGFLLKLSVCSPLLSPSIPSDCSWELVAYMKELSTDITNKGQFWIPADSEGWHQGFTISTIKSMQSEILDLQLYVEHPVEEPSNRN